MLRNQIKRDLEKATRKLGTESLKVEVARTVGPKFGDFATNLPLKISRGSKQSPMEIAKKLADSLKDLPHFEKLEVKEPGFINFFIKDEVWQKQVKEVLKSGSKFGSNSTGQGQKARVEFVSANPTGPLHFGNARGGPIGDSLAFVLEFCGYQVIREYLYNDVGVQVQKLGESILNVIQGKKLEEQEYKGQYVAELATKIRSSKSEDKPDSQTYSKPGLEQVDKQGLSEIGKRAVDLLFKDILKDCKSMGIKFDKVYPESEFAISGSTEKVLKALKAKGVLKKQEGAVWFAPNDQFLADRECVVVKSDGAYTYFANDIAYHDLKFAEGASLVIDVLGANHHGHVPRLKAAVSALGYDPSKIHVILYQWVRFKRGGRPVAMSKRSGTFITAEEVLKEVGKDAVRFFILMHDANTHIDFDLELAKKKSKENPVYYVQYAHARIASILAKAKIDSSQFTVHSSQFDYQLLTTNYELDLIKQISRLPEIIEDISTSFAVHRLRTYAIELADSFHKFYENCQVLGAGSDLESARLSLILATKIALYNTLRLLGVSAPEKM